MIFWSYQHIYSGESSIKLSFLARIKVCLEISLTSAEARIAGLFARSIHRGQTLCCHVAQNALARIPKVIAKALDDAAARRH